MTTAAGAVGETTDPPPLPDRRQWLLVYTIAIAQLVSWGSMYYGFSVLVVPMERELGWSKTTLNGALSAGLLTAALFAMPVGVWLDRYGGRVIMTAGSIFGGLLLLAWSAVDSVIAFYVIWIGIGLAMSTTLYEPAFAVVTANLGARYRTAITAVTLIAGFASTVFVPLTQWMVSNFGWREALQVLALCNLILCAGIHFVFLAGTRAGAPPKAASSGSSPLRHALRTSTFWGLLVCFTAYSATFSWVSFHYFPLLTERGLDIGAIVLGYAMIGPMQVVGRIVLFAVDRWVNVRHVGSFVVAAMPVALLLMLVMPPGLPLLIAFAVLFGSANGIFTIVRGTAVPELLSRDGYGAINGALAFPATVARALAPLAAAAIWTAAGGYDAVLWVGLMTAGIAALGFWFAATRPPVARGGGPSEGHHV
jgi:predicted MFS family arabinose efflux permease